MGTPMIRTLVVYATRYGSTEEVASKMAMVLGPSKCVSCQEFSDEYRDFEMVLLGAPIYSGKLLPEMEGFLKRNEEWLRSRHLAVFCVGLDGDNTAHVLSPLVRRFAEEVVWSSQFGGRLDIGGVKEDDRQVARELLRRLEMPPPGRDLVHWVEVMRAAMEIKHARDLLDSDMDENSRRQAVEGYLRARNTCVLATRSELGVRATPLEYHYRDGSLFIITEGGEKMAHMVLDPDVSVVVNDHYRGRDTLFGLQMRGRATIITKRSPDYDCAMRDGGFDPARIRKLPLDMNMIKVELIDAELLSAALKKAGKTIRQRVRFLGSL